MPYLEVLGDLLEGEEDRLILPLLEHVHQILDLLVPPVKLKVKVNKQRMTKNKSKNIPVQLFLAVHELLLLLGKGDELVERLLVDVAVLFQLL